MTADMISAVALPLHHIDTPQHWHRSQLLRHPARHHSSAPPVLHPQASTPRPTPVPNSKAFQDRHLLDDIATCYQERSNGASRAESCGTQAPPGQGVLRGTAACRCAVALPPSRVAVAPVAAPTAPIGLAPTSERPPALADDQPSQPTVNRSAPCWATAARAVSLPELARQAIEWAATVLLEERQDMEAKAVLEEVKIRVADSTSTTAAAQRMEALCSATGEPFRCDAASISATYVNWVSLNLRNAPQHSSDSCHALPPSRRSKHWSVLRMDTAGAWT